MNLFECKYCNWTQTETKPQRYKNGSMHLRESCANCGSFVKWHKQDNSTFRQEMYSIVKDLAHAWSLEQFDVLKERAMSLLETEKTRFRTRKVDSF